MNTAVYLLNRVSSNGNDDCKTPYELWMGKKSDVKHVRTFGEEGFEHVPKQFTHKFDAKAKKVLLVSYEGESSNYRLYHPDTRKVMVSRNVIFCEVTDTKETPKEITTEEDFTLSTKEQEVPDEQVAADEEEVSDEQQIKDTQTRGK